MTQAEQFVAALPPEARLALKRGCEKLAQVATSTGRRLAYLRRMARSRPGKQRRR